MNLEGRSAAAVRLAARLDVQHTRRGRNLRAETPAPGGEQARFAAMAGGDLRATARDAGDDDVTDQLVTKIRFYVAHFAAAMLDLLPEGADDTTGAEPGEFARGLELLEQAADLFVSAARDWAPRAAERAVERAFAFRAESAPAGLRADRAEVSAVEPHPLGRVVVMSDGARLLVTPVAVQRIS